MKIIRKASQNMLHTSLSRTQKLGLLFLSTYLIFALIYFSLVKYVDDQLKNRNAPGLYNDCHKVWATRGLVSEGDLSLTSSGNSIKTIRLAFQEGAKGSEVDIFYDVTLEQYIVSHNYPYQSLKGELLTLETLFNNIGHEYYIWLDLKKLGRLTKPEVKLAVERLRVITKQAKLQHKVYIEGEDPVNLSFYRDAGFKTIFDTQPLTEDYWVSTFVINIYKIAYYFYDFTVMGLNSGAMDNPIYGKEAEQQLKSIPLFIYHVPDDEEHIQRLANISNIKVILDTDHSANRFYIKGCN